MLDPEILRIHDDLLRTGLLAPVQPGGDDERRWLDCDLASLAENRLGDRADPRDIDPARRAEWQARVTDEPPGSLEHRGRYERCYWLMEGGDRAGTIGLSTMLLGGDAVHLSSFYVRPPYRGTGLARRALGEVRAALGRAGHSLRLDTSWCWQPAVRFYVAAGMWLYMWKRDLTFAWYPDTPRPMIEVGDELATVSVEVEGERVMLARARREGGSLVMEAQPDLGKDRRLGEAYWLATTNLALGIALRGWPLVRSREEWDARRHADGGAPEALAHKIQIWEAWANHRGWPPKTPRIPDLYYPAWGELEAEWERERQEIEARLTRSPGA